MSLLIPTVMLGAVAFGAVSRCFRERSQPALDAALDAALAAQADALVAEAERTQVYLPVVVVRLNDSEPDAGLTGPAGAWLYRDGSWRVEHRTSGSGVRSHMGAVGGWAGGPAGHAGPVLDEAWWHLCGSFYAVVQGDRDVAAAHAWLMEHHGDRVYL